MTKHRFTWFYWEKFFNFERIQLFWKNWIDWIVQNTPVIHPIEGTVIELFTVRLWYIQMRVQWLNHSQYVSGTSNWESRDWIIPNMSAVHPVEKLGIELFTIRCSTSNWESRDWIIHNTSVVHPIEKAVIELFTICLWYI